MGIISKRIMTKKHEELLNLIEYLLSIKVLDKVPSRSYSRKCVTIETHDLSENELRLIESLGFSTGRYTVEPNGYNRVALRLS